MGEPAGPGHRDVDPLYFRFVTLKRLSQQRVTPLAPGVMHRFDPDDFAITVHQTTSFGELQLDGTRAVYAEPWNIIQKSWNPCFVISDFISGADFVEERLLCWRAADAGLLALGGVSRVDVSWGACGAPASSAQFVASCR